VIVHDLHVPSFSLTPSEANAPLIVDADAVPAAPELRNYGDSALNLTCGEAGNSDRGRTI
jgi:hypothetical protein